ncbi:MAG: DUF4367 domain-containing protein [Clostridia bacterium]|nr:DUF4367 domain-containing protein [Clostridia bacterium]
MYNLQNAVFEGVLTTALHTYMEWELDSLPSDEELSVMYPTSQKMLKKYRKKAKSAHRKGPVAVVYLRRVAVIFLAVISLIFGVMMTDADVRAAVVESVVTWCGKYVKIDFKNSSAPAQTKTNSNSESAPTPDMESLVIEYVPEGYILSTEIEEIGYREYLYMTETGEYLLISIENTNNIGIGLDVESSELEKFTVNGHEAYLSYNHTDQVGTLVFGNKVYTVSVTGIIAKSELIKIAENIK